MTALRSILAGVDFSEPSRVALDLAARLGRQCGAALHVVHAEDPLLTAAARHHGIDLSSDTLAELRAFVERTPAAHACTPRLHVVVGRAVDVLCDAAGQHEADVTVVGSHGMSGATRLFFGSTTEGVLRAASRPVLVVPSAWAPARIDSLDLQGMGPVLAAVDFAEGSLAAAAAAAALARILRTSMEVVHVVAARRVPPRWQAYADAAVTERGAAARRDLAPVVESVGADLAVRVRVETGSVPHVLAEIAAPAPGRHPILVLGRRPRGERGASPGPTATRVLSLASVPVLVHVGADL
ncbi:MAG: universal stress protein [Acidobacteria bacterium]|nr:universal stress protein [Acidobacteriota bacterium]